MFVTCALLLFGCSTTRPIEKALIGKWQSTYGGITYEFKRDGTYIHSQASPAMTWRGHYDVESPNLLILEKEGAPSEAMQFILRGGTLKRLSNIDGAVQEFNRIEK